MVSIQLLFGLDALLAYVSNEYLIYKMVQRFFFMRKYEETIVVVYSHLFVNKVVATFCYCLRCV